MRRKKLLSVIGLLFASFLCCQNLMAQSAIIIHMADGWDGAPLEQRFQDVDKLAFNGSGFDVVNTKGETVFSPNFSSVDKIVLASTTVGLKKPVVSGLKLEAHGEKLHISGWDAGKTGVLTLNDITGKSILFQDDWNGTDIDASRLHPGVYILKVNNTTFKFTKK